MKYYWVPLLKFDNHSPEEVESHLGWMEGWRDGGMDGSELQRTPYTMAN